MKKILAAGALLLAAGSTMAQLYVGAGAGASRWNVDTDPVCPESGLKCDRSDVGLRAYAGYRFTPELGLEIGAHDFGKARVSDGLTGRELGHLRLQGYHVLLASRLDAGDGWLLNTRLGVGMNRVEVSVPVAAFKDDKEKADLYFGIGAAYQLGRALALRLDYDTTRGEYGNERDRVHMLTAGLELGF